MNQTPEIFKGLMLPEECAVCIIDHQPGVVFPIESMNRTLLVNNTIALVKTARAFDVPLVLSTIKEQSSGPLFAGILEAAPDVPVVRRPARRNAWGDPNFVAAVEATGRKKLVMAGLWTEVCLSQTAQSAMNAGYQVFGVTDASAGTTVAAHEAAIARLTAAGMVPVTWVQVLREFLDPNQTPEHMTLVRALDKAHGGTLGLEWELNEYKAAQPNPSTQVHPDAPAHSNGSANGSNGATQAVLELTGTWPRALVENDMKALENILAPGEAHFIESDGQQYDRASYLESRTKNVGAITGVTYTDRYVRELGDVAVMTGHSVVTRQNDGQSSVHHFSVSDVFARQSDGQWKCILGQMTPAQAPAPDAPSRNRVEFSR